MRRAKQQHQGLAALVSLTAALAWAEGLSFLLLERQMDRNVQLYLKDVTSEQTAAVLLADRLAHLRLLWSSHQRLLSQAVSADSKHHSTL